MDEQNEIEYTVKFQSEETKLYYCRMNCCKFPNECKIARIFEEEYEEPE